MYTYVCMYVPYICKKLDIYQHQLTETSVWSGGELKREGKLLHLCCNSIELPCSSGCDHTKLEFLFIRNKTCLRKL